MFYRLLLVEALFATVYSSCTPFIACNQTVYGDLNDFENGKKVVLLGRPFQKNDELIITGELFNNGSDIEDDATFTVGFAKGLIMQQLDGYPENYLLTVTVGVGESPMLVTGYVAGNLRNEYGMKKLSSPNINPTSTEFTFKIRSQDGYGFAFATEDKYFDKVPSQYPKEEAPRSMFFTGQIKTTKMELRCNK